MTDGEFDEVAEVSESSGVLGELLIHALHDGPSATDEIPDKKGQPWRLAYDFARDG